MKEKFSKLKFGKKLTAEQKAKLKQLITSRMEAFQWNKNDVCLSDLIEHEIDTGDSKLIKQRQFKIPKAVQHVLGEQVADLVKNNMNRVIVHSAHQ